MTKTYKPLPDFNKELGKNDRTSDLWNWLDENAEWREGEWHPVAPIIKSYADWEEAKHGIRPAYDSVLSALIPLGFLLDRSNQILGVALRDSTATVAEAPPARNDSVQALPPSQAILEANLGAFEPQLLDINSATDQKDFDRIRRHNDQVMEWRRKHGKE